LCEASGDGEYLCGVLWLIFIFDYIPIFMVNARWYIMKVTYTQIIVVVLLLCSCQKDDTSTRGTYIVYIERSGHSVGRDTLGNYSYYHWADTSYGQAYVHNDMFNQEKISVTYSDNLKQIIDSASPYINKDFLMNPTGCSGTSNQQNCQSDRCCYYGDYMRIANDTFMAWSGYSPHNFSYTFYIFGTKN
jgi:hypothetical protein